MFLELLHLGEHASVGNHLRVGQFLSGDDFEQMCLQQLQDAGKELIVAGLVLASGKSTIYRHSVISHKTHITLTCSSPSSATAVGQCSHCSAGITFPFAARTWIFDGCRVLCRKTGLKLEYGLGLRADLVGFDQLCDLACYFREDFLDIGSSRCRGLVILKPMRFCKFPALLRAHLASTSNSIYPSFRSDLFPITTTCIRS